MHKVPVGTVLVCVSADHADEPHHHEVLPDELVLVVGQRATGYGDTVMLSLSTGVLFRAEYKRGSLYDLMEDSYTVYEP